VGQIVVVAIILVTSYIAVNKLNLPRIWWIRVLSTVAFLVALSMAISRMPF
jgi:hypothetical protein